MNGCYQLPLYTGEPPEVGEQPLEHHKHYRRFLTVFLWKESWVFQTKYLVLLVWSQLWHLCDIKQTDRQTDRWTDGRAGRQTGRQIGLKVVR